MYIYESVKKTLVLSQTPSLVRGFTACMHKFQVDEGFKKIPSSSE